MKERQKAHERALEEAVSRALRDNLSPLQRTADELHQAYADLVAACSSSRPTNALPAMLRAQTAAAALAAGLSVLSNFVAVALNPREQQGEESSAAVAEMEAEVEEEVAEEGEEAPPARPAKARHKPEPPPEPPAEEAEEKSEWAEEPEEVAPAAKSRGKAKAEPPVAELEPEPQRESEPEAEPVHAAKVAVGEPAPAAAFDVASLPTDMQDLHRRANRVAKVAMQDIKLLRPKDVRLGREHKDICQRLRSDLDKARKEYDRRFRTILDHPVDYFHRWMVEVLAEGDVEALGEYPYPSPVLRS